MEKYSQGNTSAYNVLFKRYYDPLYGYALKNVKEAGIAEELTMDVMLGLWKTKGDVLVEDNLKAYLYRSVKNAIYNHYRKKILNTVSLELVSEDLNHISRAADHELDSRELEQVYRQKLNQLSPQRRKVYEMSREENMTYSEIARNLDLSVNTVENYMVASLSFFRKQLKEHADFTLIVLISLLLG
ncbi:RNA polymerase sigma-70 factor, ECF subfamily [Pedobacter caeni]|uniref:RNA polymerase sigma-70 factor, ECF subfamily n=1 Tax=Pedobacter caeni TaxID=288992 RepID=A0A1M5F442_9SPHI|nr:RNA polymerase sigma-70 factor, ECF subfamily [Pedobacter caeni]